jgi:phosphoadenosine phosphosulfate reductase
MAPQEQQPSRRVSQNLTLYRKALQGFSEEFNAEEVVRWAAKVFGDGLVLQTSAGIQAAVMLRLVTSIKADVKVVFVDTGYLPRETTDYMETLRKEFNVNLTIARPKLTPAQIESQHGKLWETDHELYGEITKVEPMSRALKELGCVAILSGLRSEQTANRTTLKKLSFELDSERYKLLPILDWTKAEVKEYMKAMSLPTHPLEAAGFATIGDKHSSRALKAGETNERATRFGGKVQECGLHTSTSSLEQLLKQHSLQALPDGYVLFTKPSCKFCKAAKALLKREGMQYIEKDVSKEEIAAEMYQHAPNAKTVPQIFLDDDHIGGFTELFSSLGVHGSVEEFVKPFADKKPQVNVATAPSDDSRGVLKQVLGSFGWNGKVNPPKYYAEAVLGGAALLGVAGILLQSNTGAVQSSSKMLDSTARLMSDSKLMDSCSRLLVASS